ncbi:MAG: TetR/AcrR family transcriptional regulator [Saprospirales bacterium]|nr:MAG: TetR/AcrR family transcriptional regulator [Saprospirales bacterium]
MITTRQKEIIAAAGKLLTHSGLSGLTIKNLAAEMKFTEGAIYRHFKSKEEIILTMLEYLASNMDERLSGLAKVSDPEQGLIELFENQLNFFSQHPHFVVAVFSDGLMESNEKINSAILRIVSVKMKHLFPVIFSGQQKGKFTTAITTEETIHLIIGAFRLQMFRWRALGFREDIKVSGMKTIQSVLKIIKA